MSREISEMFDDRSRALTFSDSTSKTLSDFVWGELLTIPGSKARTESQESFERTSFQARKDENQLTIPDWSSAHQRLLRGEGQDSTPQVQRSYRQVPEYRDPSQNYRPEEHHTGRKIGPGPSGVPGVPPEGYRPIHSKLEPGAVATARSLLGGDWGTETPFVINGKRYMARVEPHYGPPGRKNGPVGWHKGVTLYEA